MAGVRVRVRVMRRDWVSEMCCPYIGWVDKSSPGCDEKWRESLEGAKTKTLAGDEDRKGQSRPG